MTASVVEAVIGVGDIAQIILSRQVAEEELGVRNEELIAGRIDQVFRNVVGRPADVTERIDDRIAATVICGVPMKLNTPSLV